jgi:hypothetical protein
MREAGYLARGQLADLLDLLDAEGFDIVGPVVRDGAIQYRPLTAADDLPQGWVDEAGPRPLPAEPDRLATLLRMGGRSPGTEAFFVPAGRAVVAGAA